MPDIPAAPVAPPEVTSPVAGDPPTPPVVTPAAPSLAAEPPKAGDPPKPGDPPAKPAEPKPGDDIASFDAKAVKLPEGFKADEKLMGSFGEILNDAKASPQERGQRLLDLYAGALKQVGEANTKAWGDLNQKWVDEVKADPKIGGDKLEPTKQVIAKAIDSLGAEGAKAFREALDITGAGNNPAIIRALHAFASKLTEGGHVVGSPSSSKPDTAALFFPNSPEMKGTA